MRVRRSNDPIADFQRWEREQQEWEDSLPLCDCCKSPVDDYIYDIGGEILCVQCMIEKYRRDAEDYAR